MTYMNMCKYACVCHGFIWNVGPLDDLICYILLCSASCLPVTVYCHDLRSMCLYIYIHRSSTITIIYSSLHTCLYVYCMHHMCASCLGSASLTAHFHVCTCIHTYIHAVYTHNRCNHTHAYISTCIQIRKYICIRTVINLHKYK